MRYLLDTCVLSEFKKKQPDQSNLSAPVIQENRYITTGRTVEVVNKENVDKDEPLTFHQQLMRNEDFRAGNFTTKFIESFKLV